MLVAFFYLLVMFIIPADGIFIPFVQDVFLQALSLNQPNITLRFNSSCQQCLCETVTSTENTALNCFPNSTCQFFVDFPLSYKLKASVGTKLFFLRNEYPNASQCCMPNVTELINRLKATTPTVVDLAFEPSAFGYDEKQPSEAVVIGWNPGSLYWFNPLNIMPLRNSSINAGLTIGLHNNLTFTATDGISNIGVSDSWTNSLLATISYSSFNQVRKFVFINDGQTMIVPTQNNFSLTFIDVVSSTSYSIQVNHSCVPAFNALALTLFAERNTMSVGQCPRYCQSE